MSRNVRLTFLGTGGGMPSPSRGVSAIALQVGGDVLLFDCGEGTQRQFMRSSASFMKVTTIFITHFHGDHFLGLPGLIQSMNFSGRQAPLSIYGPPGMIDLASTLISLGHFTLAFPVSAGEMIDGDQVDLGAVTVTAVEGEHSVPALSFVIEEKGRRGRFLPERAMELGVPSGPLFGQLQSGHEINVGGRIVTPSMVMGPPRPGLKVVISGDTRPTARLAEAAGHASVLVHEATLDSSLQEGARSYGHSTAREAGEVARAAEVELLVLTHISNRYDDVSVLEEEAKEAFPHVLAATDLMTIQVRTERDRPSGRPDDEEEGKTGTGDT
ncbi:MAG: ribonuclease Z [Methanomassiliicoccus sp.]|nr:ribonuclease Z [Methanomassiliicoccus sp.]